MIPIQPAIATVRPRVSSAHSSDVRLLEEVVAEIAEENPHTAVQITGPCGSGKTTALCHLAAALDDPDRFVFLDEPERCEIDGHGEGKFVVATSQTRDKRFIELKLAPWQSDEFVEYLLARHRDTCGSVMTRLAQWCRFPWLPMLAAIVLERFAADEAATNPAAELGRYVREQLLQEDRFAIACRYCLAILAPGDGQLLASVSAFNDLTCSQRVRALLTQPAVQIPLAAQSLVAVVSSGAVEILKAKLPVDLIEAAAPHFRGNATAIAQLWRTLQTPELQMAHPMAASVLRFTDPAWRPEMHKRKPWQLRGAYFREAQWDHIELAKANLTQVDFSDSNLEGACLAEAIAYVARFDDANLDEANLAGIKAVNADFQGAKLRDAKLEKSNLSRSNFTDANLSSAALFGANLDSANLTSCCLKGADLTKARLTHAIFSFTDFFGASLIQANLTAADLRAAQLAGAKFDKAILKGAQLEDVYLPDATMREANLQGAHLSGSRMPGADLREADLTGAYLAEIDWEDADLRGADLQAATFHMGSSRSGLVGSPIASEGTRTGFYTDDYDAMQFKSPEEVRKANLRGADLRGAKFIESLDLYLVDLRDARLDPDQLEHARHCRAILEDVVAE